MGRPIYGVLQCYLSKGFVQNCSYPINSWIQVGSRICFEVSRVVWHMGHYEAPTQKPQYGYCNSSAILQLDKGPWKRSAEDQVESSSRRKTCRVYEDSQGQKRYCGTPSLKETETFSSTIYMKNHAPHVLKQVSVLIYLVHPIVKTMTAQAIPRGFWQEGH